MSKKKKSRKERQAGALAAEQRSSANWQKRGNSVKTAREKAEETITKLYQVMEDQIPNASTIRGYLVDATNIPQNILSGIANQAINASNDQLHKIADVLEKHIN